MSATNPSRRRLLKQTRSALALIPLLPLTHRALAQTGEIVDENTPQAMALGYKHDASTVNQSQYPQIGSAEDNRICKTCILYTDGSAEEWGPCSLFPEKLVSANGWCTVWQARPA